MIKAVIFDCFGVLTTDGWLAFRRKYLEPGSTGDRAARELNQQADAGIITFQEFVAKIAEIAKIELSEASMIIDGHSRNDKLFEYIRDALKPKYKIGMLSNAAANYLDELFEPWQVDLFDEVTFSYEIGVVKPDSKMYQTIAMKLGCTEEECVFIDDREGFADGAKRAGMSAVWYRSNGQSIRELETILEEQNARAA